MKVVRHKLTGRLVYRRIPDFDEGIGIISASRFGFGEPDDLEEIEVTWEEWNAELELRDQERPPKVQEQLDQLKVRVSSLEEAQAEINR